MPRIRSTGALLRSQENCQLDFLVESLESRRMLAGDVGGHVDVPDVSSLLDDAGASMASVAATPTAIHREFVDPSSPIDIAAQSRNYEDMAMFGATFIAEGDLSLDIDLTSDGKAGVYLTQVNAGRDVSVLYDNGYWSIVATRGGTDRVLGQFASADGAGTFRLDYTADFSTIAVTPAGETTVTTTLSSPLFSAGSDLRMRMVVAPDSQLTIREFTSDQTSVSG